MSAKKNILGEKMNRRQFIKSVATAGITVTALSPMGIPNVLMGTSPPEIKVGHIHPLSGFLAFKGHELKRGLMLAVEEINTSGGIKSLDGAKIKLLDGDSEGRTEVAISEVERLNKEGVVAILGCYQNAVTFAATQIAEKYGIPFMISVVVDDKITERGFKYTFRVQPKAEQMASQTCEYIAQIAKESGQSVKTIAYLHDKTTFGASLSGHVKNYAPKFGMEVILDIPYSPKAQDASTEVNKLKVSGAEIILVTGYFGDGILVLRTMRDLKVKCKGIIGCGNCAFSHPKIIKELGELADYTMDGNYQVNPRSSLTKKVFENYKKEFNEEIGPSNVFAYQSVYVLKDALEKACSTDRESIREALAKTNLAEHILPQGPIIFGDDGQNINARAAMIQVLNQEIKVVWPKEYAEASPVFPQPM